MGQHYLLQASVFRAAVLFAVVVSVSLLILKYLVLTGFVPLLKLTTLVSVTSCVTELRQSLESFKVMFNVVLEL